MKRAMAPPRTSLAVVLSFGLSLQCSVAWRLMIHSPSSFRPSPSAERRGGGGCGGKRRRGEVRMMGSVLEPVRSRECKTLREGMKYYKLGSSDLVVSQSCLGTMTFGGQLTEEQATEQLDVALDEFGVNFIDTAELYPAPFRAETQGDSDRIVGKWLKTRNRDELVIAANVAGRSENPYLRADGRGTRVDKKNIQESVDASLQRLGTDHIDLLQIHWPERYTPAPGQRGYDPSLERDDDVSIFEQLEAMDSVIKAGKVRHIGVANETPFGISKFITFAEREGLPRIRSVQNPYNLLNRADVEYSGLLEMCSPLHFDIAVLGHSPLAGGILSGKYRLQLTENGAPLLGQKMPVKGRLHVFPGAMEAYRNSDCEEAIKLYMEAADVNCVEPFQLGLKWVYSRDFITSCVVGANDTEDLRLDIEAVNCPMLPKAEELIKKAYQKYPDPTKGKSFMTMTEMHYEAWRLQDRLIPKLDDDDCLLGGSVKRGVDVNRELEQRMERDKDLLWKSPRHFEGPHRHWDNEKMWGRKRVEETSPFA